MRGFELDNLKNKTAFKGSKKTKGVTDKFDDEIEENIVRRLKKGTNKYKDKLPFKCFNFRKVGHFSSKCLLKEDNNRREEDKNKKEKKSLYSKEDNDFSKEEDLVHVALNDELLFMDLNDATNDVGKFKKSETM